MKNIDFGIGMDRRTCLKILSLTGMAGLVYPRSLYPWLAPMAPSRVVVVKDENATVGTTINTKVVEVMVESGLKALTKENNLGSAWKKLLPGLQPTSVVALKVNCINGSMSTHPVVTFAVANTLKQVTFAAQAFPENNIIIYDRTDNELKFNGRYQINTSRTGVRCFGTNSPGVGYSQTTFTVDGTSQKLSRIVTEIADFVVNLSILKNHGTSGVTLSMKNHYGTCNDPNQLHRRSCDPAIPVLNTLEPIVKKQKLLIVDALFGVKEGGPGGSPQFAPNSLLFGQDTVAIDYLGRDILKKSGCSTIALAHYIETADKTYHLGTSDPNQIEAVNVNNPSVGIDDQPNPDQKPDDFVLEQNFPNPFNHHTQVRFYVTRSGWVAVNIYDLDGRRVRELAHKQLDAGWYQIDWDGRDQSNKVVATGVYLCQLKSGAYQKSIIMQLIR